MTNNWSDEYEPKSFGERFYDRVLVSEEMEGDADRVTVEGQPKVAPPEDASRHEEEHPAVEMAPDSKSAPPKTESKDPVVERQPISESEPSRSSSESSFATCDEATEAVVSWAKEKAEAVNGHGTEKVTMAPAPEDGKEEMKKQPGCFTRFTTFLRNCLKFFSPS